MPPLDHTRQTVLITGASSGIGAEFARRLAALGSNLVLVSRRLEVLDQLAAELRHAHGVSVTVIRLDLAQDAAGEALAREVAARGVTVTALINCAGFGTWGLFHESDSARLRRMIAVNATAVVDVSRAFVDQLRELGCGYLLNVTSVAAYSSIPNQGVYSATKALVLSFTESLWAESRRTGLRVLAFAPGVTETEFFDVVGTADADGGSSYQTPAQVVTEALRVLQRDDPPPSAVSGRRNHLLTVAGRFFTRRRAVRLVAARTLQAR